MKRKKAIDEIKRDSNTYCQTCGHTLTMLPTVDTTICSYCKHKTQNRSLAWFRYNLYKKRREVKECC